MAVNGYTKLFGSIIHSTIWQEPHHVRLLWVSMLAMADQDGIVSATVPGLAHATRITVPECEEALAKFQKPDPYSRTSDDEGRRIRRIEGGWQLINYSKYRELMSAEDQKEKHRLRQQKYRDRHAASRVTKSDAGDYIAKAEAKAEAYTKEKQEQKAFSPEGQPAINLAKGLAEHLDLVVTQSFLLDVEAAIQCASKKLNISLARGCDYLMDAAIRARKRGVKVNQFWFRDADGWEPNDNYKTTAQLRNERSAAALERAFAEDAGPKDMPSGIREGTD